jgi:hypothetical protein
LNKTKIAVFGIFTKVLLFSFSKYILKKRRIVMIRLHVSYGIIMALALSAFAINLSAGESPEDRQLREHILSSKSNIYYKGLQLSSYGLFAGPMALAAGFTKHRIGKKLMQQNWVLMGPELKKQGSHNIALGIAIMSPFALYYYDLNEAMKAAKAAKHELELLPKGPSLLTIEEKSRGISLKE